MYLRLFVCVVYLFQYLRPQIQAHLTYNKEKLNMRRFGDYELVIPEIKKKFPELKPIPDGLLTPAYYKTSNPEVGPSKPEIKTQEQIDGMRQSCKLAREILDSIQTVIKVGMTTEELDDFVHNLTVSRGAYPSPLNYKGYPKSVCTSVNNVVCHGIPDQRPLLDGDIVNVDITVYYKGYHGDCSAMFLMGNVDQKGKDLVRVTLESLNAAIKACGPGKHLYDIANYEKGRMVPGMTFTIEPIIAQGSSHMKILSDGWTSVTVDGSRTAQWEHTILITPTGVEVLTGPEYDLPEG